MKIAKLVIEGEDIKRITQSLYDFKSNQVVQEEPYIYNYENLIVIMRESYYMRISSTLMSVIFLRFINENRVDIEIVASGGKEGLLMWSWGSENSENRSIVHEIIDICAHNSWEITSVEPEELKLTFYENSKNKLKEKILGRFSK